MSRLADFKKIFFLFFLAFANFCYAQPVYGFTLTTTVEQCLKGTTSLAISGNEPQDTVNIMWSNGSSSVLTVDDLTGGSYFVHVKIKHRKDTLIGTNDSTIVMIKDTTIHFTIRQEECVVTIENYFSPNGDGYNDALGINNINYYPDFELEIFDKWGQRVHHQKNVYTPWDGTWLGTHLPDGAYYYVFFYNASNRKHLVKGDVTILR